MKLKSKTKFSVITAAIAIAVLGCASLVRAENPGRVPELPSPLCDDVNAPEGYRVSFRAYAIGVQIYRWNGTEWNFQGPEAKLYADAGYHGQIGTHYAGPTWEANDGSRVVGALAARCTPSADAIPWLLLSATPLESRGHFSRVNYIQRVNTEGGLIPDYPGAFIGEEARVFYTAEYYFYAPKGR